MFRKADTPMKRTDQITGIIVLIFSGYIIVESMRMPVQVITGRTNFAPGVGFLPFWVGIFLAALSAILIVNASLRPPDATVKAVLPDRKTLSAIILFLAGLAVYISLLELLGYLVDTLLLSAFLMGVVLRVKLRTTILVALGASISLFVIFRLCLGVNLPRNVLGF